jgi:hypothetical protein
MIMTQQEIADLIAASQGLRAIIVEESPPEVLRFGRWGVV